MNVTERTKAYCLRPWNTMERVEFNEIMWQRTSRGHVLYGMHERNKVLYREVYLVEPAWLHSVGGSIIIINIYRKIYI